MMIYDITAIYTESQSKRNSGERPTREQMRAEFKKIDKQEIGRASCRERV